MTNKVLLKWGKIDWPWVGVVFCIYVVFHLLPTYFLATIGGGMKGGFATFGVWMFAGLAVIGLYIGYRSRGVTMIEPGLAALLYVFVFFLSIQRFWGDTFSFTQLGGALAWMAAAFVIAIGSAYVGELLQARKEQTGKS